MRLLSISASCSRWHLAICLLFAIPTSALAGAASVTRDDGVEVPLASYSPGLFTPCRGIAIVSPGGGATEEAFVYLGRALAGAGYLAVVVGHRESGPAALQDYLRAANGNRPQALSGMVINPKAYMGRAMDVAAARRWARQRCDSPIAVLLGHSMGATTVMIEAGARNRLGLRGNDAFDAYVALSPQGVGPLFPPDAWTDIRRPVLMITGTRDGGPAGTAWETRADAFLNMPAGCKWFGIVDGATHVALAGGGDAERVRELVPQTLLAFLDGALRHDCRHAPRLTGIAIRTK